MGEETTHVPYSCLATGSEVDLPVCVAAVSYTHLTLPTIYSV